MLISTKAAGLQRWTVVWEVQAPGKTTNRTEEIFCGIERGVPGDDVYHQMLLLLPERLYVQLNRD